MARFSFAEPDELLLYYFQQAGVDTSGDVEVEIRDIVSGIVEDAAEEAKRGVIRDLFCFSCGIPRRYVPIEDRMEDSCDCDGYEPGA